MFKRFVNPAFSGSLCLGFLIWQFSAPAFVQAQPQATPGSKINLSRGQETTGAGTTPDLSKKNILFLHAYTYETASSLIIDPIFVKRFVDAGLEVFNLHFEFMDLAKHPDPGYRSELVKFLGHKFEKRPIDLIIALHQTTLSFLLEEGKDLFPGVPVINVIAHPEFLLNEDFRATQVRLMQHQKRSFVVLPYSANVNYTVESILNLQPDSQALVVISGSSYLDRIMEQMVRRGLQTWQGRLQIEYLSSLPLEEVLNRVATLAPQTAILFANFSANPDGRAYSPPEVIQRISRAANAPVFGLFDTILGNMGIVGGIMQSHRNEAERTVRVALEILRGRLPPEPVTISSAPFIPMFDWKQLKRWGLKENRLPSGSIVLNRPKTIWSEYKGFVIGSIVIFFVQALLVIGLLIQRSLKKKAESSLWQKTEELDQFFNITLDPLCIANTDGYFLRLNPAWEKILGHSREELMAERFLQFVHPDDLGRTREAVSTLASQQKVYSFENRYRCKDGTYRWLQWSSVPAGELIYAAARDVTERKQAEEAVRQSEERFRQVAETVGDFIWEVDTSGLYRYTSQSVEKILGYRPEELIGKMHFYDLFLPEVREELKTAAFKVFAAREVFRGFPNPNTSKDGKIVYLETSGVPVLDGTGNLAGYRGADTDVTERKQIEKEALDARKELLRMDRLSRMGELSASLSHELNQPLTAILSNARAALRFLQSGKLDPGELEEILQDIVKDDKRAGDIIRSLRTLVTRDEGEREMISINDVLHEAVSLFQSEAIIRNIRIEMDLADPLPLLNVNKVQIQQVLINLMMNAAESMAGEVYANKVIVLQTLASNAGVVQVAVRDFGSGIGEQELHKIFEPFFTTKRSGLGMGLSLSRSIIESHGGHIWAKNNPDQGITFYFDLPGVRKE
jgi:PAS domain S-box-containing protein